MNIYNLNGAKECGSSYVKEAECQVTANGCNNCRDEGAEGSLWSPFEVYDGSYGDAGNGFPPKR